MAMLRVFMVRVDPHLVRGCEVPLDVHGPSSKFLDDVHVFALRRILQVDSRSKDGPSPAVPTVPENTATSTIGCCCLS